MQAKVGVVGLALFTEANGEGLPVQEVSALIIAHPGLWIQGPGLLTCHVLTLYVV